MDLGGFLGGGMSLINSALGWHRAEKTEDFQEYMSNTSYQRAAADLEKAGLNRILALGDGASTPNGAMFAPSENPFETAAGIAATKASAKAAAQQEKVGKEQEALLATQQHGAAAENAVLDEKAKRAEEFALADLEATRATALQAKANAALTANSARSAAVEADFQEMLGETGKAVLQGLSSGGGVAAKAIDVLSRKVPFKGKK